MGEEEDGTLVVACKLESMPNVICPANLIQKAIWLDTHSIHPSIDPFHQEFVLDSSVCLTQGRNQKEN